jgi:4-diphosphocytidyl-2-C-methyl-D-erythritol kinase
LYNIFEDAVLPTCSGASTLKKELLELGAISSMMSGSGPSVFGIFENKTDAENAAARLLEKGYRAYSAQTV